MENFTIKLAQDIFTSKIIHIDNASNGISCNCKCLECSETLIAVQGKKNEYHFRHDKNNDCKGSQETALHMFGKQVILENKEINLPKIGSINYSNPRAEISLSQFRPDVTVFHNEEDIYFEVAVSHYIEPQKKEYYESNKLKCVEIDLRDFDLKSTSKEIKDFILKQTRNKKLYGWKLKNDKNETNWVINALLIAGIIYVFSKLFNIRKR